MLLRILGGDRALIIKLAAVRRIQCLKSYGVDADGSRLDEATIRCCHPTAIPSEHVEFLESFVDSCRFGDYLFVHAGIRPGSSSSEQTPDRPALDPRAVPVRRHRPRFVVVHGHTISDEVEERANRIGIDTGAYRTGILTALAIEGPSGDSRHASLPSQLRCKSQRIDLGRFED